VIANNTDLSVIQPIETAIGDPLPTLGTDPDSIKFAMDRWASTLSKQTQTTYSAALVDFTAFAGSVDAAAALSGLCAGRQRAKIILIEYQASMHKVRELAPATVNLRLAAIKSFLAFAEDLDVIDWTIRIKPIKSAILRDTSGPGVDALQGMLDQANDRDDAKGRRDTAIVRLLFDLGLRRKEVVGLDLVDVDLVTGRLSVLGKARTEKEWITLPPETSRAIAAWIEFRGSDDGPLFIGLHRGAKGDRLSGQAVYAVIRALGDGQGLKTSPHRIRHSAITTACSVEKDLHRVKRFSRHQSTEMINRYVDGLEDAGGETAKLVAATLT
jgi:integrase